MGTQEKEGPEEHKGCMRKKENTHSSFQLERQSGDQHRYEEEGRVHTNLGERFWTAESNRMDHIARK